MCEQPVPINLFSGPWCLAKELKAKYEAIPEQDRNVAQTGLLGEIPEPCISEVVNLWAAIIEVQIGPKPSPVQR